MGPKNKVGPKDNLGPEDKVGPGNEVGPPYASVCIRMQAYASITPQCAAHLLPYASLTPPNVNIQHTFSLEKYRSQQIVENTKFELSSVAPNRSEANPDKQIV